MAETKKVTGKLRAGAPIDQVFQESNFLSVPQGIKNKVEKAGYDLRWIDAKKFVDSGNYHEKGWVPYEASKEDGILISNAPSFVGTSVAADNRLRRGSLILAVRPKQITRMYREQKRERTARQSRKLKDSAQALKEQGAAAGVNVVDQSEVSRVTLTKDD